jgi:hypothetical protein
LGEAFQVEEGINHSQKVRVFRLGFNAFVSLTVICVP